LAEDFIAVRVDRVELLLKKSSDSATVKKNYKALASEPDKPAAVSDYLNALRFQLVSEQLADLTER
jgi:hypothetical protein